jgi:glycosyltransferase involved in cell wall biosynthesis
LCHFTDRDRIFIEADFKQEMDMKIAYLSMLGIGDPKVASGTPYFIAKALGKRYGEVCDISPNVLNEGTRFDRLMRDPAHVIKKNINRLLKRRTAPSMYRSAYQKLWAKEIEHKIAKYKPDLIFADKCAVLFRYLKTDVPTLYRTDATFALMDGFYSEFSGYTNYDKELINTAEIASLRNCTFFIPISHWAENSAVRDYDILPAKCLVIRSHASLGSEITALPKFFDGNVSTIRFLFIGADWRRKGGELAVETISALVNAGYNVEFNVLCKNMPADVKSMPCVNAIEFIDRSTEEGSKRYHKLFEDSHFFFMPTKAECLGQVFIDALMHGVPSIALDTGAVSEVVVPGKTGFLFPTDTNAILVAEKIKSLIANPDVYCQMSRNAIDLYRTEFSEQVFFERLELLISRIRKEKHAD